MSASQRMEASIRQWEHMFRVLRVSNTFPVLPPPTTTDGEFFNEQSLAKLGGIKKPERIYHLLINKNHLIIKVLYIYVYLQSTCI